MKPVILESEGELSFLLIVEIRPMPAVLSAHAVGNTRVVGWELKPEEKRRAINAAMTERLDLYEKLKELAVTNYVTL